VLTFDGKRYLSIDGRLKDVISRGGEKVNAEEVEGLLSRHPAIAEAAVVAMPDARLGERACAFVVARGEAVTLDDIREHLAALGVAKFKWPERIEWVSRLPRSNLGKVDKRSLRERAALLVSADLAGAVEP
jgi:2,3-dihydroxybenzoate-AMP ligase